MELTRTDLNKQKLELYNMRMRLNVCAGCRVAQLPVIEEEKDFEKKQKQNVKYANY